MTTTQDIEAVFTGADEEIVINLQRLKGIEGKTDAQIAEGMGKPKHWVQERMSGKRPCSGAAIRAFEAYFDLIPGTLLQPSDKLLKVLADQDYSPSAWMNDWAVGWG